VKIGFAESTILLPEKNVVEEYRYKGRTQPDLNFVEKKIEDVDLSEIAIELISLKRFYIVV
jgi:hypothetical protein